MVRLLRNLGIRAFWHDEYAKNIFAKSYYDTLQSTYDLIISFEVFEHLPNPLQTLESMLQKSKNILFSTLLIPEDIPKYHGEKIWWYYGFEHGQHISFYTQEALSYLAKKHNLYYYGYQDIHIISQHQINQFIFKICIRFATKGLFQILLKINNFLQKVKNQN